LSLRQPRPLQHPRLSRVLHDGRQPQAANLFNTTWAGRFPSASTFFTHIPVESALQQEPHAYRPELERAFSAAKQVHSLSGGTCWHVGDKDAILRAANRVSAKREFVEAMRAGGSNRGQRDYWLWGAVSISTALLICAPRWARADAFGGSLDVTTDYLVRGISRTNDHSALQLDLHFLDPSGFLADFFASNTQFDPGAPRDAELSGVLGYVWAQGRDWQGKVLVGDYSYPWNKAGSFYNYDEIAYEAAYRDWLRIDIAYSPDTRLYYHDRGTVRVQAEWAELNLQFPLIGKLSATGGVGHYELDGANAAGYGYWSIGAAYDIAPVSLALSFVGASREANLLFYNAAVGGRWSGTFIWHF
jgi:uncharacterized protein (TIGR02001 family)